MAKKQILFRNGKVLEARSDGLYYDGERLTLDTQAGTYTQLFTDSDLVGGILTVTHSLGAEALAVIVTDDSGNHFKPDGAVEFSDDVMKIDLDTYGTLGGTWRVRIYGDIHIGGGSAGGILPGDRFSEYVTISAGEDAAGLFALSFVPRYATKVTIDATGLSQKNALVDGVTSPDFTVVNDNEVHFNANSGTAGLTNILAEGDELRITYEIDDPNMPLYDLFDHSTLATKDLTSLDRTGAPYTLVDSVGDVDNDHSHLVRIDGNLTIPTGLHSGFQCIVLNVSAGPLTVTMAGLTLEVPALSNIVAGGLINVVIRDTDILLIKGELA